MMLLYHLTTNAAVISSTYQSLTSSFHATPSPHKCSVAVTLPTSLVWSVITPWFSQHDRYFYKVQLMLFTSEKSIYKRKIIWDLNIIVYASKWLDSTCSIFNIKANELKYACSNCFWWLQASKDVQHTFSWKLSLKIKEFAQ